MNGIINIIIQATVAFSLYSLVVVVYTLLSAWKNINIWQMNWDWKVWLNGIAKYLLLGGSFITLLVASYAVIALAPTWGVEIPNMDAISNRVLFGVMALAIVGMIVKCLNVLTSIIGIDKEVVKTLQETSVKTDSSLPLVIQAPGLPTMPADYVKQKLADEQEGGIGAVYSVPFDTYQVFKNTVNGNAYDIDNYYGAQCWDGAALLWQQMGLALYTGNGLAIGCWDLKRDQNKYDKFELITDVNSLQLGDVVVMRPNHIGFFDGWNGSAMRILGQNQSGNGNGSPFNIVTIARSAFAGAFRYNGWVIAPTPTPAPSPTPIPVVKYVDDAIVSAVIRGDYGNGAERKIALASAGYDPNAVQIAVNAKISGQIAPDVSQTNSVVQYTYKSGDTFGQVISDLGLATEHGLWGADGDVNYYTAQLHAASIYGNIPVGTTITLIKRQN